MFDMMNGKRVEVTSDKVTAADNIANGVGEKDDVNAIASKSDHSVAVLVGIITMMTCQVLHLPFN